MRLEIIKGDGESEVFETYERNIVVGRGQQAECCIQQDGISREHLRLDLKGSDVYVTDMGSSNGTYIQDKKLEPNKSQIWPPLFPIRMGSKVAITLLPDTEAIDSTLARVHNPFIQKNSPAKKSSSPPSCPPADLYYPSSARPRSLFLKTLIFVIVVVIFVGILYFNPLLRAKILQWSRSLL